jgi:hypothetical protein
VTDIERATITIPIIKRYCSGSRPGFYAWHTVPALAHPYVIAPLYFPGNQGSLLASLFNKISLYQEPPVFFALKAWPVPDILLADENLMIIKFI